MKAFLADVKKVPSLNDRFARIVRGVRREGQLLMRVGGIPSGPGEADDFIFAMARFRDKASNSGSGGMLSLIWFTSRRTCGGLTSRGSKKELK